MTLQSQSLIHQVMCSNKKRKAKKEERRTNMVKEGFPCSSGEWPYSCVNEWDKTRIVFWGGRPGYGCCPGRKEKRCFPIKETAQRGGWKFWRREKNE